MTTTRKKKPKKPEIMFQRIESTLFANYRFFEMNGVGSVVVNDCMLNMSFQIHNLTASQLSDIQSAAFNAITDTAEKFKKENEAQE